MKVVAVIVYNRSHNIERWIECWDKSNITDEHLVIIDNSSSERIKELSRNHTYIPRKNIGFDIGAFQDVCMNRLEGFPEYESVLWCTDDTLPMSPDFTKPFFEKINNDKIGIVCMKISGVIQAHVRTTGFCIKRKIAEKLKFPADTVRTKEQCYMFEHQGKQTMTLQIRHMGLSCEQIAPDKISPLWDSGYHKRLDRINEHEKTFGIIKTYRNKVTVICTIFETYPQIISSLILQTHQDWELFLIHDGPCKMYKEIRAMADTDPRIKFIQTKIRKEHWGHPLRKMALDTYSLGEFVVITNADNYYVPTFMEYMIKGFKKSHTAVATYCEKMIHSYRAWDIINCRLELGYIDCGGVMVRSEIAREVGWRSLTEHSADWTYFNDIATKYTWRNFIQVKGSLFVHN